MQKERALAQCVALLKTKAEGHPHTVTQGHEFAAPAPLPIVLRCKRQGYLHTGLRQRPQNVLRCKRDGAPVSIYHTYGYTAIHYGVVFIHMRETKLPPRTWKLYCVYGSSPAAGVGPWQCRGSQES